MDFGRTCAPVRSAHLSFCVHCHAKQGAVRPPRPSQLRCFLFDPQKYLQSIESTSRALYGFPQAFLYRKRPLQQNGGRRKRNEKEDCTHVESKQLQGHPPPPLPLSIPSADAIRGSQPMSTPLPHPRTPHCRFIAIFSDLGQKRGQPPFRSSKVLQLSLDSYCDYVRVFSAVIGRLEAKIDFWIFLRKW